MLDGLRKSSIQILSGSVSVVAVMTTEAPSPAMNVRNFLEGVGIRSMEEIGVFLQGMNAQIQESDNKFRLSDSAV